MNSNTEGTQPGTPIIKKRRGRMFLINGLLFIIVVAVTALVGYRSGIGIRKEYAASVLTPQLAEQFQLATEDLQAGRYALAKQRLDWIILQDPTFPGTAEKLTEVLVQINLQEGIETPTPTPSLVPTPDFSGAQEAFNHASQLIAAQDWVNALAALDQLRKLDSTFNQPQVDGMYYFAFRNYGYDLIARQGNLEGGIYQLALAERFGPLDRDTAGLREGARVYLIGASFWELDWQQALFYFEQARGWGNLWDGTMTAVDRYKFAAMRYGDELFAQGKYCEEEEAIIYYQNALTIGPLDKTAQNNYAELLLICFPPTATFDPNSLITPTIETIVTTAVPADTSEPPTETPTATPTETPTETPTSPPP